MSQIKGHPIGSGEDEEGLGGHDGFMATAKIMWANMDRIGGKYKRVRSGCSLVDGDETANDLFPRLGLEGFWVKYSLISRTPLAGL